MANDDLGHAVDVPVRAAQVVSLVPSITESLVSVDRSAVVGATDWCTHPADLDVARVRGTKNPDLDAIRSLAPDLVIANQEENRELDVRRLRESGVPVWVTRTESVPDSLSSLRRLLTAALGWDVPGWLPEAEALWAGPGALRGRVGVAVWRDPWMAVGRDTFTGDLVARLGLTHVLAGHEGRYPHVEVASLDDPSRFDLVLLPDEPYVFTAYDGPEAFTRVPTLLVSGRDLTWYGPSLVPAHERLTTIIAAAL
ncbi:helical backbone metal receptor [Longivirga aurantiaca]|uniref:Helical backbone metal receptor n=1 Tax=Longivirga aurantiaca TaxID=1837743 RepID=A0ABW1SYI5_9ACTN